MARLNRRRAVTRLDVVVVGVLLLMAFLLVPGCLSSAREAGRRAQCSNNLKQIALSALSHNESQGFLPSGGWGSSWVGDPDRGFGRQQPGGFFYNILPYLEQQSLHDLGRGLEGEPKKEAARLVSTTAIPVFICPSRRAAAAYPFPGPVPKNVAAGISMGGRGDYGANGGSVVKLWGGGPESMQDADAGQGFLPDADIRQCNGISFQRSDVRKDDVTDGLSNTYLVGEKFLNPSHYVTGDDPRDALVLSGADDGLHCWADGTPATAPACDKKLPAGATTYNFGSAHAAGFNVVMCDGCVRQINYSIAPQVHKGLATRNGGERVTPP